MEEVELSGVECHEEPHWDTIPKTLKPIELCGEISTESFDQLMRRIQVLQYNLKYEELKQCTISLMDSRNIDLKIMGMLTETTGCTFRGDLAEGIKLTDLALKLCDSSACMNGQILRTRVFYVKSSLYRNQGDGQRAQQYLDDAVAGSCGITSFFDSSIVAYQRACVYVEQGNVDKAKECFVRAIEDSRSLSAVYLPIIQQKASIGLALAYLGCSKYYPQMPEQISGDCTSHHDMESAWTLLYNMDTEAMPERTKVELHIANSILFYKKKMTTKAIHQAQCAIRICAACNVRGEMEKSARELLNHMQQEPVSEVS